ncbi:MAG TPA: hypothetical protein VGB93_03220, partial [Methylovirgula sp.]
MARYYGELYETISRLSQIYIARPARHFPETRPPRQHKIGGRTFIVAPIFLGALIGSTFEFNAARAQQASTGGTEALPQIDV